MAGVPEPVKVLFPPIQTDELPVTVIVGKLLTLTVKLAINEQPLPSKPVTV